MNVVSQSYFYEVLAYQSFMIYIDKGNFDLVNFLNLFMPVRLAVTFSLLEIHRDRQVPPLVQWSYNVSHTSVVKLGNSWWFNLHIDSWIHLVPQHFACSPLKSPYMRTCMIRTKSLLHICILLVWEVKP